jgi:hypothetical protein
MTRTAQLVRCNAEDADRIRFEAQREHCSISAYVLHVSLRTVAADERLFSKFTDHGSHILSRRSSVVPAQRTAILVRCDVTDAERIREAARRRDIRINAFVLRALKSTWNQQVPLRLGIVEEPLRAALSPGD